MPDLNPTLPTDTKPLLAVLAGETRSPPPLWMMRQAGRYLPEYRALRAKASDFLDFCFTPTLAAEATLQPIRRFGFDAAIVFSDILVVPAALGQDVRFVEGEGPRLEPLSDAAAIDRLPQEPEFGRLAPMFETLERVRSALPTETALIGFCGAPWTVASYMIAGRGTPDQAPARLFAYQEPEAFQRLIDRLVRASIAYLVRQIAAGAEVVQIFDSWAGVLPEPEFRRWCLAPLEAIVAGVRAAVPDARIIAFPRGAGAQCLAAGQIGGLSGLSLDTAVDPSEAARLAPAGLALQGNIDPLALVVGGAALDRAIDAARTALAGRPHIVNLGHGILPHTPIAHVEQLVARVRAVS